jgi:hypothetical protein
MLIHVRWQTMLNPRVCSGSWQTPPAVLSASRSRQRQSKFVSPHKKLL